MIGKDGGSYLFNKASKTVTITGLPSGNIAGLDGLLLIVDVTNNTIIYNFADLANGATCSNGVFTLTYDTTGGTFNNNDILHIHYYDSTPQSVSVDDLAIALKMAMAHSNKSGETSRGQTRVVLEESVAIPITGTVNVSSISTSTYMEALFLDPNNLNNLWLQKVRAGLM